MTPQRTQRAVVALVDANIVQVVRSSGCFLHVGTLGELVDALRDRCRAEGREYVSAFAERHWEKVNAEVLAKEREAACEATSERREQGGFGKRAREEEEAGVGGDKRAREEGEDVETGSREEEEEEEVREDARARGAPVRPMPTTTSRTVVGTTRTMPPPPMSLTERLTRFRRVPPPTTRPATKPTPTTKTPTPPIQDANPPSFRALGATILRGVHTIIHERDETLRRDMRTLVDAINTSHREIAALRLQIDDLVDARQRRATVARVSSPMDDSPNAGRPDDVDERVDVDDARRAERVVSPCFEALVAAANRARAPTRSTPSSSPAPLERSNETMKIRT